MWKEYNSNPVGRSVGDCAIRALTIALYVDWETAYAMAASAGFSMGDMPSSDSVWGAVLRQHGFYREACKDCGTAEEFARDHIDGVYVLAFGGHVAALRNGVIYDTWDCSNEVPIYYWYKKGV